ncbi:nucleotidyltransferase [Spirochaetia bacterium]|nr:nucleotidyltransferase [Spirochaetia bacterium]
MGGSNGYFKSNIETLKRKINSAEKNVDNKKYESDVSAYLNSLLSKFNDRDVDQINTHLGEILKTIKSKTDENFNVLLGGSVSKNTYVDGLSDIDTLLILNDNKFANKQPNEIKQILAKLLKERFPNTEITVGNLAITVSFSDCDIQLLPAIRSSSMIKIQAESGNTWSKINAKAFNDKLTAVNSKNGGKVIPVIKLAKAIIGNFSDKQKISGYHAESLAIKIFNDYKGELNSKSMLQHFLKEASSFVLSPISDKTGQSVHVDEYLGVKDSLQRQIVSGALSRAYRRLVNADNSQSKEAWEEMFK